MIVRAATAQEVERWDQLTEMFPNRRVFHKRAWLESIRAFSGARPLYLVFEQQSKIVSLWPGFLAKISGFKLFVSPREGWQGGSMGPLVTSEKQLTEKVLAASIDYLEREYRVQQIEFVCRGLSTEGIDKMGFRGEPVFTQRVQLSPNDSDGALRRLPQKTRNQLRKAQKLALVVRVAESESFVDEFYDQARMVFTRNRAAMPFTHDRVLQLFRSMRGSGHLLPIAVYLPGSETCIATGIFLVQSVEMYLWGWAHRHEYGAMCPMELLTWTAMQKGMAAGCTSLDMAGGGKAKEKYGAVPDFGTSRWLRSRYRWLGWLRTAAKKGYRLQQSVRGQLSASFGFLQRQPACQAPNSARIQGEDTK